METDRQIIVSDVEGMDAINIAGTPIYVPLRIDTD